MQHLVRRITTTVVTILTCTCGKRIMGQDAVDCHRRHQLHILEVHREDADVTM